MKKMSVILISAFVLNASLAQKTDKPLQAGSAPMYSTKNIIDNAMTSKDHTTLVAVAKVAGLVEFLQGAGPFTLFAPTNQAFAKLPKGTIESLVKPENKATLTRILTYHVLAGKWDAKAIVKLINDGNGTAELKTVSGDILKASMKGNKLTLTDQKGRTSEITIQNIYQSNGVMHVVNTVLFPS